MEVLVGAFNKEKEPVVGAWLVDSFTICSVCCFGTSYCAFYNEMFIMGNLLIHSVHLECHLLYRNQWNSQHHQCLG